MDVSLPILLCASVSLWHFATAACINCGMLAMSIGPGKPGIDIELFVADDHRRRRQNRRFLRGLMRPRRSRNTAFQCICLALCIGMFLQWHTVGFTAHISHGIWHSQQVYFQQIGVQRELPSALWSGSRKSHNKSMHSLHGNGAKGRGKGSNKGRGKAANPARSSEDSSLSPFSNSSMDHHHLNEMIQIVQQNDSRQADRAYRDRVKAALPAAAWALSTPMLVSDERDARVCLPNELGPGGGISYIHKDQLPDVLQKVGFTTSPCGIITSQSARDLGLPYGSTQVRCGLKITNSSGQVEQVEVTKFLTQLGFGKPVEMATQGPCVAAPRTMIKVVIRYDIPAGVPFEELNSRTVANTLSRYVNEAFFLDIVTRADGTATAMVQDTVIHSLLEASGTDHVFFKPHSTEPISDEIALHWLSDQCTYEEAMGIRDSSKALGLALKRTSNGPKYGLRFANTAGLEKFLKDNSLGDRHLWGRFKATNIPTSVGFAGLHSMLSPYKWKIQEVEYFGEGHAVFLASERGTIDQMFWKDHAGRKMPVRIHALNARAKAMSAQANQASQSKSHLTSPSQMQIQKEIVQKRQNPGQTGHTPQSKVPKQDATQATG